MTDPQNHEILAFRRLVYRFSLKLTKEESRALVYIRLYDCKERYGNADTLEVLSKLETDCVFSPNNPEGLIEVAQDINRSDLQSMVKDFMKKRQRKAKANVKTAGKTAPSFESESAVSEEELQLKAILEVTLSHAAVFVKQVDILQQAITAGTKEQRQRAVEAISDAICTAEALTGRLQKARGELQHSSRNSMSSLRSSTHSSGSDEDDYYNLRFGKAFSITEASFESSFESATPLGESLLRYGKQQQYSGSPETAQLVQAIGTGTETPTPMPRRLQIPIQESQDKLVQTPTKEAWYPAKDTHHQQMVSPKTRRWTTVDSGSKSTQSSPLQTKQHVSQYKPVQAEDPAHEAHIHQQRTPRWTQIEDSGTKMQPSPLQTKNSPRPKRPKPAVPPKPSRTATSVTKTVECPSDSSSDYTTLNPDIETDGSTKTGTDDSGFEEWKQKFQSPIQKDTEGTEVHYYKSLRRDEVDADAEYQTVKH